MKYYNYKNNNGFVMVRRNFLEHKSAMGPWRFHAFLYILLIANSENGWVEIDGQDLADHFEFENVLGLTKKAALDKGTKILKWLVEEGYLRVIKNPPNRRRARTFEVASYRITGGDLDGKYTQSREKNRLEMAQICTKNGAKNVTSTRLQFDDGLTTDERCNDDDHDDDRDDDHDDDHDDDRDSVKNCKESTYTLNESIGDDDHDDDHDDEDDDVDDDDVTTLRQDSDETVTGLRRIINKEREREREREVGKAKQARSAPAESRALSRRKNRESAFKPKINTARYDSKQPATAVGRTEPASPATKSHHRTSPPGEYSLDTRKAAERVLDVFKDVQPDNWDLINDRFRDKNLDTIAKGLSEKVSAENLADAVRWVFSSEGKSFGLPDEIKWPVSFIMHNPEKLIHHHRVWKKKAVVSSGGPNPETGEPDPKTDLAAWRAWNKFETMEVVLARLRAEEAQKAQKALETA